MRMKRAWTYAVFAAMLLVVAVALSLLDRDGTDSWDGLFSYAPEAPTASDWILFSTGSNEVSRVLWDFGDGQTAEGVSTFHRFATPGSYNVKVEIVHADGSRRISRGTVPISASALNEPSAVFWWTPESPITGSTVSFQAYSYCIPECTIADYVWDFGDGRLRYGASQTHVFPNSGTFAVRLTVLDASGGTASAVHEIEVRGEEL